MTGDVLSVADDEQPGEPLIEPVMHDGKHPAPRPTLADIRAHAADNLGRLPTQLQRSEPVESYPIEIAEALMILADEVDRRLASKQEQRQ